MVLAVAAAGASVAPADGGVRPWARTATFQFWTCPLPGQLVPPTAVRRVWCAAPGTAGLGSARGDLGRRVAGSGCWFATGRRATLGVAAYGIGKTARAIATNQRIRAAHGLWAIGDITGKGTFTHLSMYQAAIAVADILGQDGPAADYRAVPRVTFTDPEIGSVGLTEAQPASRDWPSGAEAPPLPSSARGWIHKPGNDGFIKLIEDRDRGVLVGATSAGPAGGEVLGALASPSHGQVPVARLQSMIYAHPTFHRAIQAALDDRATGGTRG